MRRTVFGFNQQKALELGLTLQDLLLLNYIQLANSSHKMKHIDDENGNPYVFISHTKLHEDIPILNYTEGTLKNKLSQLKKQGIIVSMLDRKDLNGTRAYYALSELALDELFEDYIEDNNQVISELPTRSLINDQPGNLEVTSYNKLDNIKLEDNSNIINNTGKPVSSNSELNNDLGIPKRRIIRINDDFSEKEYKNEKEEKKQAKRLNLYDKCILAVDDYTQDRELNEALKNYLSVRLKIKEKPMQGVNQWKGMLTKLSMLKGDKVEIVTNATANGWAGFFEVNHNYANRGRKVDYSVFGETEDMKIVKPEDVEGGEFSGIIF